MLKLLYSNSKKNLYQLFDTENHIYIEFGTREFFTIVFSDGQEPIMRMTEEVKNNFELKFKEDDEGDFIIFKSSNNFYVEYHNEFYQINRELNVIRKITKDIFSVIAFGREKIRCSIAEVCIHD